MPRFAIRVLHPPKYAGDIFECSRLDTQEDYEEFRTRQLDTPTNFEVVQLDENGQVIP